MEKTMRLYRSAILAAMCLVGLAADSPAPVSDNTLDVVQPDNAYLRLNFAADLQHSLWVEVSPHNTVAYASRADKP